jgi:hypothetical protein
MNSITISQTGAGHLVDVTELGDNNTTVITQN